MKLKPAALLFLCFLSTPLSAQILTDATATSFPTPAATDYTNHIAAGDLDGDGDLDIVFANGGNFSSAGSPQVQRVYINNGSAVFTDESAARLNFSGLCRGVAMGDIDGDGDLDLAFAQDFNRLPKLFRNNGSGSFTDVSAQLPNVNLSSSRGQFVDIDNDGDLDLFFVNANTSRFGCGQYKAYVNNGAGTFTDETATRLPAENVCEPMDVVIGDVDGDFDLDVMTAGRGSSTSRLYRNNGAGVFTSVAGLPADDSAYSYDMGDVDGDGDLDFFGSNAAPSGSNGENLWRNNGNASFTDITANITPNSGSQDDNDSKFFDYDNDGDLDVIVAQLGGGEKVYQNNGSGVLTLTAGIIQQVSDSTLEVLVADLNHDKRLDVVTGQGESGSFVNRIYLSSGTQDSRAPRVIATEEVADTPDTTGPYLVRAAILDDMSSDRNFFAQEIVLTYTVDGGPAQTVAMQHSGGQIYRAAIPGQAGGQIAYSVEATDFAGNTGFGTSLSFNVDGEVLFADGFESGNTSAWVP